MGSSGEREAASGHDVERPRRDEVAVPLELTVHDEVSPCPYLPGAEARMPLRVPIRPLTRAEFDRRLAAGNRRHGKLLYRTECPSCRACEPIRIVVRDFVPGRTQRRVLRRGEQVIDIEIGPPTITRQKIALYNLHKHGRGLMRDDGPLGAAGYEAFLVDSCCETFEMRYHIGGRLVGVAIVDRGQDALSAVYSFYDPELEPLSPGVFSILKQVELCRTWGLRYLYLGLYVEKCSPLVYKARYLPHERLIDGRWQRFDRSAPP
ncbi:arginyl-tRNA-protein transferase [Sorangium cellulosum]|uniref:Aspartate/glutamate leucyltransferase n=1 Tax=Sorangium cellulosum TaxID=56 RepID=A0A4P2Q2F2_SORCE|nr:arginyl-tRNA-protein transferase [Sorangium cellulosum]